MSKTIVYPLKLTPEEHATIKRRADAVPPDGMSLQKYIKAMAINGKLSKRTNSQSK